MNFNYITDAASYETHDVLVMLYNLILLYFMWDVAKYMLGIVRERITRFVRRKKD